MSGTILVGIDGSECGERALDFAIERAQASGANLIVAYVIEWSPYTFNTPQENEQRHRRREEELRQAEQGVVEPALQKARDAGVAVEGVVRHGHAAKVLSQLASDHGARMIIIGRRGQTGLKAMLFGSVAGTLVQIASVPVTVVP